MDFRLSIFFIYFTLDEMVAQYRMFNRQDYDVSTELRGYHLWPGGIIPYLITGHFHQVARDMITRAMDEFHQYTCIRFVPYSGEHIYIRIISENSVCRSFVGYINNGYDVNLGPSYCTSTKGRVTHELMHAIGFSHEHNRPDRDNYVFILYDNIIAGFNSSFTKDKDGYGNNIGGLPYDYRSVMHYDKYAFSANGEPTIVAKNMNGNIQLGQYDGLSQGDIDKINIKYSCSKISASPQYSRNTRNSYGRIVPKVPDTVPTTHQFTRQKKNAKYRNYFNRDRVPSRYSYNVPYSRT